MGSDGFIARSWAGQCATRVKMGKYFVAPFEARAHGFDSSSHYRYTCVRCDQGSQELLLYDVHDEQISTNFESFGTVRTYDEAPCVCASAF